MLVVKLLVLLLDSKRPPHAGGLKHLFQCDGHMEDSDLYTVQNKQIYVPM